MGVAAEFALNAKITLRADLGFVVDQQFGYLNHGVASPEVQPIRKD